MITGEIIVFIATILFGIAWYWRESKNNKLYRFFNKVMHSKALQMKPENRKAFVHKQPFLMRLVWVTLLFLVGAVIISFLTPFNMFYLQYFASAIAGTLIGTYIASFFFVAKEGLSKENIEKNLDKAYNKGKELVDDIKDEVNEVTKKEDVTKEENTSKPEEAPKKSARDRLKDKGMIN